MQTGRVVPERRVIGRYTCAIQIGGMTATGTGTGLLP
jgi:hypothetical protein